MAKNAGVTRKTVYRVKKRFRNVICSS
nr:hypothetical protein [Enterococcus faecium]